MMPPSIGIFLAGVASCYPGVGAQCGDTEEAAGLFESPGHVKPSFPLPHLTGIGTHFPLPLHSSHFTPRKFCLGH